MIINPPSRPFVSFLPKALSPQRTLSGTKPRSAFATYGRDCWIAPTLFRRDSASGKIGRQMQTSIRFPEGWRLVAAHVSLIDEPKT